MKNYFFTILYCFNFMTPVSAQQVQMSEMASFEQVYGDVQEASSVISMNELGMEFGYVLYEADVIFESVEMTVEVENIRDYAAVYIDREPQGDLTDENKKLVLKTSAGRHKLQLYVENTGRITYGPDILDNSKGLFGAVSLNGAEITEWKITPLLVKECAVDKLQFVPLTPVKTPCFYKGHFQLDIPKEIYLDVSGWGMGEVWVNGQYMGAYWEENSLKSIQIHASALTKGVNNVVIFDLKNNCKKEITLSDEAIFN